MSEPFVRDVKLLKCPSCGAPVKVGPADAMAECEYCRSHMTIASMQTSPKPTTIIVETRRGHIHRHRLRKLLESAEFASKGAETSSGGGGVEG